MKITESSQDINAQTSIQVKETSNRWPKPPVEGLLLTVLPMLEYLTFYPSVQVKVVNTSPSINFGKIDRFLL